MHAKDVRRFPHIHGNTFMQTIARALGMMLFVTATTTVAAQPSPGLGGRPGTGPMSGGLGGGRANPVGAPADFLLAHTGELSLTDAQVVRLASISRRADARRKTMMARMDSARAAARPAPGDSVGPRGRGRGPAGPPPAEVQQMRADVRDAIAVLTPDQQATAWMMIAGGPSLGRGPGSPMERSISRPPAPRDVPRRPDGVERTEP